MDNVITLSAFAVGGAIVSQGGVAIARAIRSELRIDAVSRELRSAVEAQGKELHQAIEASSRKSEARDNDLRVALEAQVRELRAEVRSTLRAVADRQP